MRNGQTPTLRVANAVKWAEGVIGGYYLLGWLNNTKQQSQIDCRYYYQYHKNHTYITL